MSVALFTAAVLLFFIAGFTLATSATFPLSAGALVSFGLAAFAAAHLPLP